MTALALNYSHFFFQLEISFSDSFFSNQSYYEYNSNYLYGTGHYNDNYMQGTGALHPFIFK